MKRRAGFSDDKVVTKKQKLNNNNPLATSGQSLNNIPQENNNDKDESVTPGIETLFEGIGEFLSPTLHVENNQNTSYREKSLNNSPENNHNTNYSNESELISNNTSTINEALEFINSYINNNQDQLLTITIDDLLDETKAKDILSLKTEDFILAYQACESYYSAIEDRIKLYAQKLENGEPGGDNIWTVLGLNYHISNLPNDPDQPFDIIKFSNYTSQIKDHNKKIQIFELIEKHPNKDNKYIFYDAFIKSSFSYDFIFSFDNYKNILSNLSNKLSNVKITRHLTSLNIIAYNIQLLNALQNDNLEKFKSLVSLGLPTDYKFLIKYSKKNKVKKHLQSIAIFFTASKSKEELSKKIKLVGTNPENRKYYANIKDFYGQNALYSCIFQNRSNICINELKWLISIGCNVNNGSNNSNKTLLVEFLLGRNFNKMEENILSLLIINGLKISGLHYHNGREITEWDIILIMYKKQIISSEIVNLAISTWQKNNNINTPINLEPNARANVLIEKEAFLVKAYKYNKFV